MRKKIDIENVIVQFKISNLNKQDSKINTRTGQKIDFSKSNYDWIKTQIDFYNSGFRNYQALKKFKDIVYRWYYNYAFKKYKTILKYDNDRIEDIYEWAENAYLAFLKTYQNRINLIKYVRGLKPLGRLKKSRKAKSILNKKILDTNENQFKYFFQSKIGSLSIYAIGIKIKNQNKKELSYEALFDDKMNGIIDEQDKFNYLIYKKI